MKKVWSIIGIVFGVIVIVVICLGIWQRDNIKAVMTAMQYNSEQVLSQISENDKKLKEELSGYFSSGLRDYTEEEKEKIASGEWTEKEVLAKIISEKSSELAEGSDPSSESDAGGHNSATVGQQGENGAGTQANQAEADRIISKYVSQLYALEGKYLGKIDAIVSAAYAEYVRTAKHSGDTDAMMAVGARYLGQVNALEASCDGEVEAVLSGLRSELSAIGADTGVVQICRDAYENEKTLKRAYYMSLYK